MICLKERLANGEKISGTMLRIARNPAVMILAKNAGLDYVMFDCEHSNYNMETLHDMFIMCNAIGLGGFLRVPNGTKEWISRALDASASGVMVPMIENGEQAENLVRYSKYQPVGGRGYCGGIAYSNYKSGKHADMMERQNARVISIAQIETRAGVENADEIASVKGIDALLIGPNDLSIALGVPGDLMNPIELEAISRVAAACKKHGKAFGLHAGGTMLKKFANELTLIMCGSDTDILNEGFKNTNNTIRDL